MASAKQKSRPWKRFLTKEEAAELSTIDRDAQKIDADRRQLTARRSLIVNRAIHRAKYQNRSSGPPPKAAVKTS